MRGVPLYSIRARRAISLASVAVYAVSVFSYAALVLTGTASAAILSQTSVRFDRMKATTATTGTVCAKSASTGQTSVTVTFPTGYAVSTVTTNWATSTTNLSWPTGASPWVSIGANASTATGQVVSWTSGSLIAGTLYCFNWTNTAAVTTASAGVYTGTVATNIDTATPFGTAAIANDQIAVSATVAPTFTFAINVNTDNLGQLATGSVVTSPTPRTATVNSNAKNGWYVWAKDATTGLNSVTTATTIASTTPGANSTLSAGSEGYNTGITQTQTGGSGTITVAAGYVGGATGKGGGLDTTLRSIASSTGTANNAVLTITNNASISNLTLPATDYTDTITLVGAGLF